VVILHLGLLDPWHYPKPFCLHYHQLFQKLPGLLHKLIQYLCQLAYTELDLLVRYVFAVLVDAASRYCVESDIYPVYIYLEDPVYWYRLCLWPASRPRYESLHLAPYDPERALYLVVYLILVYLRLSPLICSSY
jgi:hypothetical protein